MPIYEYECAACGHHMEAFQTMSEPALTKCPTCQQAALQKLISASGFQLKGTGWYVTDYRDKAKPKAASEGESSGQKEGGGDASGGESATTTDTKTDTKKDTSAT